MTQEEIERDLHGRLERSGHSSASIVFELNVSNETINVYSNSCDTSCSSDWQDAHCGTEGGRNYLIQQNDEDLTCQNLSWLYGATFMINRYDHGETGCVPGDRVDWCDCSWEHYNDDYYLLDAGNDTWFYLKPYYNNTYAVYRGCNGEERLTDGYSDLDEAKRECINQYWSDQACDIDDDYISARLAELLRRVDYFVGCSLPSSGDDSGGDNNNSSDCCIDNC